MKRLLKRWMIPLLMVVMTSPFALMALTLPNKAGGGVTWILHVVGKFLFLH